MNAKANAPLLAGVFLGAVAMFAAHAAGVPYWTGWHPGDAEDLGLFTGAGIFWTLKALRPAPRST